VVIAEFEPGMGRDWARALVSRLTERPVSLWRLDRDRRAIPLTAESALAETEPSDLIAVPKGNAWAMGVMQEWEARGA
jgi:hypothetical protein